jgi:hypothetical protein
VAFVVAAALAPLGYAAYTNQVWEDYLITFRYSQNLCEGQGLVYRPGERVHGFTSPLGTLLPALCHLATGQRSYLAALWAFRVLSALAFVGAGLLLLRALRESGAGRVGLAGFGALYVLEAKAVAFSANGMETAFVLLFLAWGLLLTSRGPAGNGLRLGLCGAGLLWARPDGFVPIAALALASVLFAEGPRKPALAALAKAGCVCAAAYLPWFAAAWAYYASPVPNTVWAKAGYRMAHAGALDLALDACRRLPRRVADVFLPAYYSFDDWPAPVLFVAHLLGLFAALYWLLPLRDRLGRLASFVFLCLCGYLAFLSHAFPWYLPPAAACGLVAVARGGARVAEALRRPFPRAPVALAAVLLLACAERLWLFAQVCRQMRAHQAVIEDGNRRRVGLWLRGRVAAGERVYVEPLGYIGYFSAARMLDYPGLVSPEVVRAAAAGPPDFVSVGLRLRPEWMVLRPDEEAGLARRDAFRREYEPVKEFDVNGRLGRYGALPGRRFLRHDAAFKVYRRRSEFSGGPARRIHPPARPCR